MVVLFLAVQVCFAQKKSELMQHIYDQDSCIRAYKDTVVALGDTINALQLRCSDLSLVVEQREGKIAQQNWKIEQLNLSIDSLIKMNSQATTEIEVLRQLIDSLNSINPYGEGAIPAEFSVGKNKKIVFSRGNLQYQASTQTWRFAEHQYDIIGKDNAKASDTYVGWVDLFEWASSGYTLPQEQMTTIAGTNYDWGVYNKISNGGVIGQWRTLTTAEWVCLFNERENASNLYGFATVNGVEGIILLPDNWTMPEGCSFKGGENDFSVNTYATNQWEKIEEMGAVFLPAAGYLSYEDEEADPFNSGVCYWSSSASEPDYGSDCTTFEPGGFAMSYSYGMSAVRLVKDAK